MAAELAPQGPGRLPALLSQVPGAGLRVSTMLVATQSARTGSQRPR